MKATPSNQNKAIPSPPNPSLQVLKVRASSSSDQTGSQLLKALGAKTTLTGRGEQQVGAVPHTSMLTGERHSR